MTNQLVFKFDEQEFVLICRKKDYFAENLSTDKLFLAFRDEWENGCNLREADDCEDWAEHYQYKTFDLLLARVDKNVITLPDFIECPGAVVITERLPFSQKSDFMEVPKESTIITPTE